VPLGLILLAWLLRCRHLDFYDFRGDEVFGINYATAPLGQVIGTLAEGEPHPPLFYLLLHAWIPVAGNGEYALRWLSTAGDALGVVVLYVLGRRIAGPRVGGVAALVLSLAPYHIWNAQDARMYTLATAFVTTAVYWAWRLLIDERPNRYAFLGYVLAMLLALYTHYYSLYMVVLINVFAAMVLGTHVGRAWASGQRRSVLGATVPYEPAEGAQALRIVWWLAAQALVALLYVPWMIFAWRTLTTYHGNAESPSLGAAAREALRTFALGWDLPQHLANPLLPLFAVTLLLGAAACLGLRYGRPALLLLLLWLIGPIAAIWLASRARPIFDVRYLIEASPPFYLLLALPALWWRRRPRLPALLGAVAVPAVLLAALPALWSLYLYPTDGRGHGYTALGRYLAGHAGAGDVIIVNHLDPVVRYYAERNHVTAPLVTEPEQQGESPQALNAALSRLTAGRDHVWLIPDDVGAWDPRHTVLAWCNRHLQPLGQVANGFHVIEFQPWTPTAALNVSFGNRMTLTGIRLNPTHPAPGRPWPVVLFWQAPAPTAAGETVSVQLLNAAGRLVAQLDAVPQAGQAPTTGWQPFETIPDLHTLPIPAALPPGRYTLAVAVYPSAGGPRLSVPGTTDGLAPVATVTVP
jgi:mannosyltransferase